MCLSSSAGVLRSGASYTSAQIEQASIASPDLAGVPPITTAADNATLNFPVVGGGSTPQGTSEKKVDDLKKLFDYPGVDYPLGQATSQG